MAIRNSNEQPSQRNFAPLLLDELRTMVKDRPSLSKWVRIALTRSTRSRLGGMDGGDMCVGTRTPTVVCSVARI